MPITQTIRGWMQMHVMDHVDASTGEINRTSLVEAWDHAEGTGDETLDPNHDAWDIALDVTVPAHRR